MKNKILILLSAIFFLLGCQKTKTSLPVATGTMFEVIVVMDEPAWSSLPGNTLRETLDQPMEALPQPEPIIDMHHCQHQEFSNMYKSSRNILITEISEKHVQPKVIYTKDKWASPQAIVQITAPNDSSFANTVRQYGNKILDYYVITERERFIEFNKNHLNLKAKTEIEQMFGIQIDVPSFLTKSTKKKDFYWLTNDNPKIRQDLVIYSYPYTDKNTFTKEYLLAKRDTVMKTNIPGEIQGSYMGTEYKNYPPIFREIWVNGGYCAEIKGLWKMINGAAMGGPFYSHTRLDEINQKVITVEGFVFAPGEKKRNAIRQLEAVIYTTKLPQEINALKEVSVTPKNN